MRWLIPLVALLWALTGAPASAGVFLATSPVSSGGGGPCAGDPFPDGCIGAPAPLTAQWAQPSFFIPGGYANTTAATSIDYSGKRPFWKVAGVDYHIGNYTPALSVCTKTVWDGTCLLDPAKPGIMPAGCSYTTGGVAPVGVGVVTCSGATFAHFNMGPVNGHGCTAMRVGNTLTIDDVYLFNDTGQCSTTSVQAWLSNNAGATYNITITNTYLDGNWHNAYPTSPSCPSASCNSSIPFFISGNILIKYSVVNNWFGRSLTYVASNPAVGFKMQYSYAQCWDYRPWSGHGELFLGSGTGATPGDAFFELDYTTVLGCADSNQGLTVTLFPAAVAGSYGPTTVSHNVVVLPNIGLPAGTLSVSATGFVDNGAGNGTYNATPGNVYTITSVTGNTPVGHGPRIPCGDPGNGPFVAAGGGYVWQPIVNPSLPAGMQQMTVEGSITQSSGISLAIASCNGSIASQANGSNGVLGEGAGPAYTLVGNYVDPTALNHSPPLPNWVISAGATGTFVGSISGGMLTTTTSQTFATGDYIIGSVNPAVVGGCTSGQSGLLTCPQIIAGGTGTSFALSFAPGNIGNTALAHGVIHDCAVMTVWGTSAGQDPNVDMSGNRSAATENSWNLFSTAPYVGPKC